MASLQCTKTTEKGLNQGYYVGSSFGQNANWGCQATKKEKYQGSNGYEMSYSERERHSQIHYPAHGMGESQTACGKAETWNATSKTQFHGRGNGYGSHSSNGIAQAQAYGSNNHISPGKHQGPGYGYGGGCPPRNQKISGGMDHSFGMTEAYGYEETNGRGGKYTNNGMVHNPPHHHGKQPGQGNGFIKHQAYGAGRGRNMAYGITETETETHEYSEMYYSNESHYNGGAHGYRVGKGNNPVRGLLRKIKDGISGNRNCSSDSDSDSDDDGYRRQTVCVSKAI